MPSAGRSQDGVKAAQAGQGAGGVRRGVGAAWGLEPAGKKLQKHGQGGREAPPALGEDVDGVGTSDPDADPELMPVQARTGRPGVRRRTV